MPTKKNHVRTSLESPHTREISALRSIRSGTALVTGSYDSSICFWNFTNNRTINFQSTHEDEVNAVDLNHSETLAYSVSDDGQIICWNLPRLLTGVNPTTGKPPTSAPYNASPYIHASINLPSMRAHRSVMSVAAAGNDSVVLFGEGHREPDVLVCRAKSLKVMCALKGHVRGCVAGLAVSHGGELAASSSLDCEVHWWDVEKERLLAKFEGHKEWVTAVAMDRYATSCVSGSNDEMVLSWDPRARKCVNSLHCSAAVRSLSLCPLNERLLAIGTALDVSLVDIRMWRAAAPLAHAVNVSTVQLSPCGQFAFMGLEDGGVQVAPVGIDKTWRFETLKRREVGLR
mmetsp:Transcript_18626/g.46717  ORF Transcript_18626/g.46717 Transcript_18626/m.46717 type:complete len:344 (-) Transcript_18626:388-1419(-)